MRAATTYSLRTGFTFGHKPDLLIEAVEKGEIGRVQSLLAAGDDPNARKTRFAGRWGLIPFTMTLEAAHGKTLLMLAAAAGNKEMVLLLLKQGADLDVMNAAGWTALSAAIEGGHLDIAELLLHRGADINVTLSFDGRTLLSLAVAEQAAEMVKMLLENGADVNIRDHQGYTALRYAREYSYAEILQLLEQAGSTA